MKPEKGNNNKNAFGLVSLILWALMLTMLFRSCSSSYASSNQVQVPYSTFRQWVAADLVKSVKLESSAFTITLKDGVGLAATVKDITANPKNVKITEVEAAQVPMALPDHDFGVINGNYAVGTELADTILVSEDPASEAAQTFANIVAVKPGKENDAAVQALVKVLTSEETRKFITEKYGVSVVPVF